MTVTAGVPIGKVNYTNSLRVLQLTEELLAHGFQD